MTTIDLLRAAKIFTERSVGKITMSKKTGGEEVDAKIEVYTGYIPEKEDELKAAPYILIQAVKGTNDEEKQENTVNLRFVIVLRFEDSEEGYLGVLEVLERLQTEMRKSGLFQNQYGIGKIEWLLYPQDTKPYYIGEMTVECQKQNVKRVEPGVYEWLNG